MDVKAAALTDLYRLKAGLSPLRNLESLTIGYDRIQRWILPLLREEGSSEPLALVTGPYGAGKTHTLQVARLIAARHGFASTTISLDLGQSILGNPQRLVSSLVGSMEFLHRQHWTDSHELFSGLWSHDDGQRTLLAFLREIRAARQPVSAVAREAIDLVKVARSDGRVESMTDYLFGVSLAGKANNASAREAAYGLVGLWAQLFRVRFGCRGLLVVLDEVETLFRPNVCPSIASRRAAYRALSGFLGGRLDGVRGLWAITPDGLTQLNTEFEWQLGVAKRMQGVSHFEDVDEILARLRSASVHALAHPRLDELMQLARSIAALHVACRGPTPLASRIRMEAENLARRGLDSPRVFARAIVSRLESEWQATALTPVSHD